MCQLFIEADRELWQPSTKSVRIKGVVTSIRLEGFFWELLEELAFREEMTVTQLITSLYLESIGAGHDIGNFTSFLRVCCSRYLALIADEQLQRNDTALLSAMNAGELLRKEALFREKRKAAFSRKST